MKKFAKRYADLPDLPEDHIALIHRADESLVDSILGEGLDYSKQGMIDSMATAHKPLREEDVCVDDPRFNYKGCKAIVMYVPLNEYKTHRNVSRAPGKVEAKHIVGVLDAHKERT